MTNKEAVKNLIILNKYIVPRKNDTKIALQMAIEALKWADKRGIYFDVTKDNKE